MESLTSPSLRLGLLLDSLEAPRWVHGTLERLLQADSVDVAAIIINSPPGKRPESLLFRFLQTLDEWVFRDSHDPLTLELKNYPVHSFTIVPFNANGQLVLSDKDVARVIACELDVLVQLGTADLPHHLTGCAKHGIWNFRYRGYRASETESALVSNLYTGRCVSELTLYEAKDTHDAHVLYRGTFDNDLFSLYRNRVSDCRRRSSILLKHLTSFSDFSARLGQ
jgi:hypothetical protein